MKALSPLISILHVCHIDSEVVRVIVRLVKIVYSLVTHYKHDLLLMSITIIVNINMPHAV